MFAECLHFSDNINICPLLISIAGPRYNKSTTYEPLTKNPFAVSPGPDDQEESLDILGDDDDNDSRNNVAAAQGTSVHGFDINLPNQHDLEDEIADEGLNAAEALRAQVNIEALQRIVLAPVGAAAAVAVEAGVEAVAAAAVVMVIRPAPEVMLTSELHHVHVHLFTTIVNHEAAKSLLHLPSVRFYVCKTLPL
jgi:hypothetical protein